jgi:hypothetical protein
MARVGATWPAMGELTKEGREGEGEGEKACMAGGGGTMGGAARGAQTPAGLLVWYVGTLRTRYPHV